MSDLAQTLSGNDQANVSWRISSGEPATIVSVYANPGAITVTQVFTNNNGMTQTMELPHYSGELLKTNVLTPLDGATYTTSVSLNVLPSGNYHIWVEADDGNNPPTRAYAPNPIEL